ncbi:hypothetical protein COLO4_35566 [Corchorus olitorius]|uniref:Uncharacterized protein n=1 Tax=Corchorus olitorius TaxID=93759 RepID=A0A1R3GFA6_9ROSI|nr:hypothetical protein COLO4_35566 [Corchorus olitorius]
MRCSSVADSLTIEGYRTDGGSDVVDNEEVSSDLLVQGYAIQLGAMSIDSPKYGCLYKEGGSGILYWKGISV